MMTQHEASFEYRIRSALRWIQDWKFNDDCYWSSNIAHVTITATLSIFFNIATPMFLYQSELRSGREVNTKRLLRVGNGL